MIVPDEHSGEQETLLVRIAPRPTEAFHQISEANLLEVFVLFHLFLEGSPGRVNRQVSGAPSAMSTSATLSTQ